jgi:hypothetical protein
MVDAILEPQEDPLQLLLVARPLRHYGLFYELAHEVVRANDGVEWGPELVVDVAHHGLGEPLPVSGVLLGLDAGDVGEQVQERVLALPLDPPSEHLVHRLVDLNLLVSSLLVHSFSELLYSLLQLSLDNFSAIS